MSLAAFLAFFGDELAQSRKCVLDFRIVYSRDRLNQAKGSRITQEFETTDGLDRRFATLTRLPVEKERHGHVKKMRNPLQPARTYSIDAFFVFLDLLKGYAEAFGQRRLR